MGNIIVLHSLKRGRKIVRQVEISHARGEIVIFPGVRYERLDDDCCAIDLSCRIEKTKGLSRQKTKRHKLN